MLSLGQLAPSNVLFYCPLFGWKTKEKEIWLHVKFSTATIKKANRFCLFREFLWVFFSLYECARYTCVWSFVHSSTPFTIVTIGIARAKIWAFQMRKKRDPIVKIYHHIFYSFWKITTYRFMMGGFQQVIRLQFSNIYSFIYSIFAEFITSN